MRAKPADDVGKQPASRTGGSPLSRGEPQQRTAAAHYGAPDGISLGVVAVEQALRRPALHSGGELPSEVGRILQASIHALTSGRRVTMCGVAGEEHSPDP